MQGRQDEVTAMQFTELSELNHVVGLMRLGACNSPTFHDRQDSEVDRIYNSSPKVEVQMMRNSWIDKMTAFKPMSPVPAAKKAPTIAAAKIPAAAKGGPMDTSGPGGKARPDANGKAAAASKDEQQGDAAKGEVH